MNSHVAPLVSYSTWEDAFQGFQPLLMERIERSRPACVGEIGGGANPSLALQVAEEFNFRYVVLDISEAELQKAPAGYEKRVCDIASKKMLLEPGYDLMFSRMLAEHVPDGEQFHRNVYSLLKPGGVAIHFMPSFWALPFILNRLLTEGLSNAIWRRIKTRERSKFPAYYSWCFGPTAKMLRRFSAMGYEVVEYRGFFGHGYYRRIGFLHRIQILLSRFLARHPSPHLTSYICLILRKPLQSAHDHE